MAYPMIAVILISRRESEYFDLNQKDLRRAAVKSGRIVQILRELFALLFANHAAKNSVAVAKSSAMPVEAPLRQNGRSNPRRWSEQS